MKSQTEYAHFAALDIRVGRVLEVSVAGTRKPTYRLKIDFGPVVGERISCGALRNYDADALVGRLVVGVVNFPPLKMGPERSEVLVLGVDAEGGGTIHLTTESPVEPGAEVF